MRYVAKGLLCCSVLLAGIWLAQPAQSAPISGSFSMSGGWIPIGGTGTIATATGMDFIPNPGVSTGQFSITAPGGTGNFGSLSAGETGVVKDFVFAPQTGTIDDFLTVGGFTMDLVSSHVVLQNGNFLLLDGVLDISGNGLTDQHATLLLASTGMGTSFSWTATAGFEGTTGSSGNGGNGDDNDQGENNNNGGNGNGNGLGGGNPPTQVPEPMSLAMLGMGLVGYGIMRRRQTR